jgi:DHA2 family multidrug resistance protein-like MFS transporter
MVATDAVTAQPSEHDGLPVAERRLAVTSTGLSTFTSTMDFGLMNVALPTIALGFGVPASQAIWVITAFQIANTATLLLYAALGDSLGPRRVYLAAVGATVVTTVATALAPSMALLILIRAVHGTFNACLFALAAPLNRLVYPRAMLGRALANNTLAVSAGGAAGPTIGGLILAFAPWPALFWFNSVLIVAALWLGLRYLPHSTGTGARVDAPSVVLGAIGIGATVYGLGDIVRQPTSAAGFIVVGLAVTAVFIRRQLRIEHPLLAVDFLLGPRVGSAVLTCGVVYIAYGAAIVSLPFYLQRVLGYSPAATGLLMLSWPVTTVLITRVVGALGRRFSPVVLEAASLAAMACGLVLFTLPGGNAVVIVLAGAISGAGIGVFQVLNVYAVVSATKRNESGKAMGISATSRAACYGIGAALVAGAFAAFGVGASGLWISFTACLLGAVIALVRSWSLDSARDDSGG